MAMLTAHDVDLRPRLTSRFGAAFGALLVRAMDARARHLRIEERRVAMERLLALSDDQLAARQLTRSAIPSYVFRDLILI